MALAHLLAKYQRIKIHKRYLEKMTKTLIATNLVRLGLVKTQKECAKMLSIHRSCVFRYLHRRRAVAKLLKLQEIKRLSREYLNSEDSDAIIKEAQEILRTIAEIYEDDQRC